MKIQCNKCINPNSPPLMAPGCTVHTSYSIVLFMMTVSDIAGSPPLTDCRVLPVVFQRVIIHCLARYDAGEAACHSKPGLEGRARGSLCLPCARFKGCYQQIECPRNKVVSCYYFCHQFNDNLITDFKSKWGYYIDMQTSLSKMKESKLQKISADECVGDG